MTTIAVDAMGGDQCPSAEVEGAILAARDHRVRVLLTGRAEQLEPELAERRANLPIEVVHAQDVVTMADKAAVALRTKRDSSMRVAARLVRDGAAQGLVSAGNTGAVMATVKTVVGVVPGVYRPALAQVFPTLNGQRSVLVDVGANADCTPDMLVQFALMGEIYSKVLCGCPRPRVGLLSIGEEEHKGNDLTRATTPLLKAQALHFVGNVEGRDLYSGEADVIVCDGFTGNVALKVSEGVVSAVRSLLRESLGRSWQRRIGYALAKDAFQEFRKRLDYSEYGGAPLLGIKGVCLICHGRSNAVAIKNAIRIAAELSERKVQQRIEKALHESFESTATG